MMKRPKQIILLLFILFMTLGCASKIPHTLATDFSKMKMRLIAVMPVNNLTVDLKAGQMLRDKIISELYFKGYPKISPSIVDEKLSSVYGANLNFKQGNIPPETVGELLRVDAVLYCTLSESKTSYVLVYAPTDISATFELRSVKTGETLWSTRYKTVRRSYGFFRKDLEMKSFQVYELAIQEVVDKIMETLPDGPDL